MSNRTKEKIAEVGLTIATLAVTGYISAVLYCGLQTYFIGG
jgi:hypothetical protein